MTTPLIVQSNYVEKWVNPQQIATKAFSTDFYSEFWVPCGFSYKLCMGIFVAIFQSIPELRYFGTFNMLLRRFE